MNAAELGRLNAATLLLQQAHTFLEPSSDGIVGAVAALVDCAYQAAVATASNEADAALEALACARAAVVASTYVVRRSADHARSEAGKPVDDRFSASDGANRTLFSSTPIASADSIRSADASARPYELTRSKDVRI